MSLSMVLTYALVGLAVCLALTGAGMFQVRREFHRPGPVYGGLHRAQL